jgi:hypothetical protein
VSRLAIIAVAAAAAGLVAAAMPASAGTVWSTCQVQATLRTGVYRVDNDEFTGPAYTPQRSCITSADGHDLTIVTGYRPGPGGVVAAPSIRVGPWFASRDPGSVFPVMAGQAGGIVLREHASGLGASGLWLLDTAVWLYSHANGQVRGHPVAEVEIGIAETPQPAPAGWRLVKIAGTWFWLSHHLTGTPGESDRWPLTVLRPMREHRALTIPLVVYLRALHHLHDVRLWQLAGSVQMHAECWSGCGGLSYSLVVTGPAAYVPPPGG